MAAKRKKKSGTGQEDSLRVIRGRPGHVTFLRIHEIGSGYGGGRTNAIDADVIFRVDSHSTLSFGFELRDDEDLPVRRGMLDLVRDAMTHGLLLRPEYLQRVGAPGLRNCTVIRIELERPAAPPNLASALS